MNVKPPLLFLFLFLLFSCNNNPKLPVYGSKIAVNGKDSMDYTLPDFVFVDQDGNTITLASVQNKVHVAEFFFTSCPSICPKMQKEMLRVYEKYKTTDDVAILAYSIDPVRDSIAKLRSYASKLGVENSSKWHFLTGDKDSVYSIAHGYLVSAAEDPDAPGGHIHSGNFILVDKHQRIRGYYDGTTEESVQKLMSDMDALLNEQ